MSGFFRHVESRDKYGAKDSGKDDAVVVEGALKADRAPTQLELVMAAQKRSLPDPREEVQDEHFDTPDFEKHELLEKVLDPQRAEFAHAS